MEYRVNVSIIIPAFNCQETLGDTLRSLHQQSEKNWECIIIDDKSTDRTVEVAEEWCAQDERFRLIKVPNNFGGPAGPRNLGVAEASGKYIAFLDSDDLWHPDKLQRQIQEMSANGAVMSCTGRRNFRRQMTFNEISEETPVHWISLKTMLKKNRVATSSVILEKSLVQHHSFNEAPEFRAIEDFDCWLRIMATGVSCLKIDAVLLGYRLIDGQISGNKFAMARKFSRVLKSFRYANDRPLGWRRYIYFCTYAILSVLERLPWFAKETR